MSRLLLTLAFLLVTGPAGALELTKTILGIGGGTMTVYVRGPGPFAAATMDPYEFGGTIGKVKRFGTVLTLTGNQSDPLLFVIQYPFVNDGWYREYRIHHIKEGLTPELLVISSYTVQQP